MSQKWLIFYDVYDNNDAAFAAVADNRLSLVNMDGTDNPDYTRPRFRQPP